MAESTNRVHVSPGVYASKTVDMKAATKSVGVTKLAIVGEFLKGPAFQAYPISSPNELSSVFGGTSTKKFAGSNYPQYEGPYIASEYLKASKELYIVRTLGLSGYNAGPAWLITGEKEEDNGNGQKYVIAVLRSRGSYKYRSSVAKLAAGGCTCSNAYDSLTYEVGEVKNVISCDAPISYNMDAVKLDEYSDINSDGTLCAGHSLNGTAVGYSVSSGDMGRFTIKILTGAHDEGDSPKDAAFSGSCVSIPVSLNPSDKDYILKVLGTSNSDGDQPLFVESLYDVAWNDLVVNKGYDTISEELTSYDVAYATDYNGLGAVSGLLTKHEGELTKKDLGKRFLFTTNLENASDVDEKYYPYNYSANTFYAVVPMTSVTIAEAASCETVIENNEVFEIVDGVYAGLWTNKCGITHKVSELIKAPQILGGDDTLTVAKASGTELYKTAQCKEGYIYTVSRLTDKDGVKHYVYRAYDEESIASLTGDDYTSANDRVKRFLETNTDNRKGLIVYSYEDGLWYKNSGSTSTTNFTITGGTQFVAPATGRLYVEGGTKSTIGGLKPDNDGMWAVTKDTKYTLVGDTLKHNAKVVPTIATWTDGIVPVECDLNNYKSKYRYSSTPWVVSNAKGDANHINLNKMFRFHTISDGATSVEEVKVSIENIRPDLGQFDVVVRSYNDSDGSAVVLERFSKCTMASGKKNIAYQIGTLDGQYVSKSKYITVEMATSTAAINSIPAGFLGYPIPRYDGATVGENAKSNISMAPIAYNTTYNEDKNKKRQYFGISDLVGYDYDYFSYKGDMATIEDPEFMCHGFHLDCRLDASMYDGASAPKITVDGVDGYQFDTVSVNARTSNYEGMPIIASEDDMAECIYADVKLRKFTMCFAGGFDGWDVYRSQRTNTDEFAYTTYKGYINKGTGNGYAFNILSDAASYDIEGNAITSDYYSTLAGVSLLKNPEAVDVNLIVTPGIDTLNNAKLVQEVFNILEDRADAFSIVTTPDMESGAGDGDEPKAADEIATDLADSDLHCEYAATYAEWIQIEDNGEYIWLPVTRDIVRNMAESDNSNTTQNKAPAGTTRGKVSAIRARKNLKDAESDALYEANINPVRTYSQEGIVVMGQKTLREEDDLLNRIDVMRCYLRLRKLIAIGTLGLVFEPGDDSTTKSFKKIISSIMQTFIDNRAISNWKMNVDESDEAKDRLEIPATIIYKPVRAIEYITLNFVVTNDGTYFEE